MERAKIVYVQLNNKRTVKCKLDTDESLSLIQEPDGDHVRIPGPYVSDFMDALHGLTADKVQQQQPSLAAALNGYGMAMGMSQYPRCHKCNTIKSPASAWVACDFCGLLSCNDKDCTDEHFSGATHPVTWKVYQ